MKYDIESILEMYEDDYNPSAKVLGPRNMKLAQVPRSEMDNFNTPDLEQAPDSYLRPGETLEDFDVEFRRPNAQGGVQQLVSNTVDGSRPGYNIGKLVTETKNQLKKEIPPLRKYQLNERLKFLEQTKLKAKNIKGSKSIENLILKKDKLGRPFFSEYLEKLNALKDIQDNKYVNPKTKKPFTPKEWLDASATTRSKYRNPEVFLQKKKEYQKNYMAEKKKDPKYKEEFLKKKKEEYYSSERKKPTFTSKDKGRGVLLEQRNRLLSYMSMASKDNPNYKEIIKDGKFLGVTDKSTGVNYYEAGYKGKLGKNSKLITNHPDFENVNNLSKLADKYKRALPNKAISSYFNAYERVPTMSEMQNFLQADPRYVDKMSSQYFKTNPLHLHHQISVTDSPSKKLQLLLQDKNDQAGKKMMEYKKGNITEKKLNTELKKLNARYVVDGKELGAIETSPETQLKTAKMQTTKLFNKTLKANPKLVEDMTKKLLIKLEARGCGGKAAGGRILFSNGGEAITSCAKKGVQGFIDDLKKGNYSKATLNILKGGGNVLKNIVNPMELLKLRNLIGPGAMGLMAAFEAGVITDDVIRQGTPLNESLANNWLTKTFLPYTQEYAKAKNLLETGKVPSNMKKYVQDVVTFNESLKDMQGIQGNVDSRLVDDSFGMIDGSSMYSKEKEDKDVNNLIKKMSTISEDVITPGTGKALEMKALQNESEATRMAKKEFSPIFGFDKLKDVRTPGSTSFDYIPEETPKDLRPITYKDYEKKELPAAERQYYENKYNIRPRSSLSEYYLPGAKVNVLDELTSKYNMREAAKYPGFFSADSEKFSEGGITTLRSKYEYKK